LLYVVVVAASVVYDYIKLVSSSEARRKKKDLKEGSDFALQALHIKCNRFRSFSLCIHILRNKFQSNDFDSRDSQSFIQLVAKLLFYGNSDGITLLNFNCQSFVQKLCQIEFRQRPPLTGKAKKLKRINFNCKWR